MKIRNLLVAVSLAGFAPTAAAAMDAISATDQKIANKSVIAASVSASKAGYLVVHEADATGTKPGKIIGNVAVKVGENKDVTVPLMSDVKTGSKLILMLHEEIERRYEVRCQRQTSNDRRKDGDAGHHGPIKYSDRQQTGCRSLGTSKND